MMGFQSAFQLLVVALGVLLFILLFVYSPRVKKTEKTSRLLAILGLVLSAGIAGYSYLLTWEDSAGPSPLTGEVECDETIVPRPGQVRCKFFMNDPEFEGTRYEAEGNVAWHIRRPGVDSLRFLKSTKEGGGQEITLDLEKPGEYIIEAESQGIHGSVEISVQRPPEPLKESRTVSLQFQSSTKNRRESQRISARPGFRIVEWRAEPVSKNRASMNVTLSADGNELLVQVTLKPIEDLFRRERAFLRARIYLTEEELTSEGDAEPPSRTDG